MISHPHRQIIIQHLPCLLHTAYCLLFSPITDESNQGLALSVENFPYFGQILALLTAAIWALAVILFKKSGETFHPLGLNVFKNVLALVLFLPTIWLMNQPLIHPVPIREYLLLMISGVLGIGIGDTFFFRSLNRMGAGLSAVVVCLYSPFIIGLSVLWLGERLTALQALGAVVIVSAVLLTARFHRVEKIERRDLLWGILWGVLSTAATAVGIVMIKPLLERSPLLWALEIRLFGGLLSLLLVAFFFPAGRRSLASLSSTKGRLYMVGGAFVGTYLAMLAWLAGMKYAPASIASALNETSTIFVFILAALFLHEPISIRRVLAILLAFSGALLIFLG
jgi:drug/metabolite transporter (DMT)-like permease